MKDFEQIESLLQSKSYNELSPAERKVVDQQLTAESYEELRIGMQQLKGEKLKVGKDVKASLMAEFRQEKASGFAALFQRTVPAYSLVLPLLVIALVFIYRPVKEVPVIEDRIVEVMVRDTVEVIKTDTLWRDKVVKVPQLVYVTREESQPTAETPTTEVVNRSLSDQKDVLDLVVRGE